MRERAALRAEVNHFTVMLRFGGIDCRLQRFGHHNHAGAAAKRSVIDVAQFVVGKLARVDAVEMP